MLRQMVEAEAPRCSSHVSAANLDQVLQFQDATPPLRFHGSSRHFRSAYDERLYHTHAPNPKDTVIILSNIEFYMAVNDEQLFDKSTSPRGYARYSAASSALRVSGSNSHYIATNRRR